MTPEERKAKTAAYMRKRRLDPEYREKQRLSALNWKRRNKEKIANWQKKYREKNKEHVAATMKKWRENNKEKIIVDLREWCRKNKDKIGHRNVVRYRLTGGQSLAKFYKKEIQEFYRNRPAGYHVDHIVPIKGKGVCGLHVPWNLQYLLPSENSVKKNKFDERLAIHAA